MIEISELNFSYSEKVSVLNGINLNWDEPGIHGLIGANGSGKTTLFKILKGLVNQDSGSILRDGIKIDKDAIAYLSADPFFYPRMKGKEYLHFFEVTNPEFRMETWNEIFDLPLNDLVDTYSTGMKKKLAIMACIGLNRDILLFDEPFNGLDSEAFQILQEILINQKDNGKTIILSSHISHSLSDICHDIAHLEKGKISHIFKKSEFNNMDEVLFSTKREQIRNKLKSKPE